ncbi:Rap1a/Tai family immunity protein [Bradyrhizobium sp. Cp5.3]|uniref:Rap1a/Tai family immunity protein n=1 Tax=Bradyrhizobium TaxID=374 RepID=UPI0035290A5E
MRVYIVVAGLVLSVIGKGSATVVDKGNDLKRSCQLLVQNSFRDQDEARSAGACEGMIETAMIFSPNLPANVRACPPAQGSPLQSAKVLLRYVDGNPDRVSEPGITLALEALRDAWPCHGDDAGGPRSKKRAPTKSIKPTPPASSGNSE